MRFRDGLTTVAGAAAIATAVLAVGGVLRWSQALVALLVAGALAASVPSRRGFARLSPLVVLLATASLLTAIQLLPLGGLADVLSPTQSALRADGAELLGLSPSSTLTNDVGATLGSLVMLLSLLGLAIAALRMSTSERGRYRIVVAVALLCGVTAIITWIHKIFLLDALYGIYEPAYARPLLQGPIVNSNTLACLMAVGSMLGIGLAAHRRQPNWARAAWLLVVIACGSVVVATVSRGATLALVAGSFVTIGVLLAQRFAATDRSRRRRARLLGGALPMGILAGCLVVLVIWSNAGNVERQLSRLSLDEVHQSRSKFAAWRSAVELVQDAPWFGVGRGAFEASFTRVHHASGMATYSYLENEYLQAVVDWGVPGAVVLALALIWLAYVSARRWRDGALAAGTLGALAVVAMQSNVDFGLEFLGLAAPVTALTATVAYVPLRDVTRPALVRGVRIAHVAALLVGACLLMTSLTTTLDEDRSVISKRVSFEQVRVSVERHPLDYYGYAVAADLLAQNNDPRAIRLLNHALALHPTHPQLHVMAAHMLYRQGFIPQAAVEYATALGTTADPRKLIDEILGKFTAEQAATAFPLDYTEPEWIVQILETKHRLDVARMWLARVLELNPKRGRACDLLYKIGQTGDVEAVRIAGRRCLDRLPDYQTRLVLAKELTVKNAHDETIRLLADVETWQARRDEKIDGWLALCDAHKELGNGDEAKRCLRRLDASSDMLDQRRTEILKRIEAINNSPAKATATGSASPQ